MGIHYDYKSKRGERAMLRQVKREQRLAERKAKKSTENSNKKKEQVMHDIQKPITLEDLTNPNKNK